MEPWRHLTRPGPARGAFNVLPLATPTCSISPLEGRLTCLHVLILEGESIRGFICVGPSELPLCTLFFPFVQATNVCALPEMRTQNRQPPKVSY